MPVVLGADGAQETYVNRGDRDCCPILFPSACALKCNFIQLLPDGPLWDVPKAEALARYAQDNATNTCTAAPLADANCATMVNYAAYLGDVMLHTIENIIWPSVRESNPFTAVTTLDSWLERVGWQNCFATLCRSTLLGQITPYEIQGVDGPILCNVPVSDELACALKKAILTALQRLQVAGVKTLDVINWIIEPLDSVISPYTPPGSGELPEGCATAEFIIDPINKTLPACDIDGGQVANTVPAVITPYDGQPCGTMTAGLPTEIYPGAVAAECIVRSLLNRSSPNIIHRGCGAPAEYIPIFMADLPEGMQPFAVDTPTTQILSAEGAGTF